MSCDPHPLVSNPCADDSVSVGQALGLRGDVNFDESGYVNLLPGVQTIQVPFLYQKDSPSYVFEYLYIRTPDGQTIGQDIRPVPIAQTVTSFTVDLSGKPTISGCVLYWHVIVPDPLQACQGLVNGPSYAQAPFTQNGLTLIPAGQDTDGTLQVTFPQLMPDNQWVFEALTIEYNSSYAGGPVADPSVVNVYAFTVMKHTTAGFKLGFQAIFLQPGYALRWRVAARPT